MLEELFLQLSEFFSTYSLLFSSFLTSLGFHVFPCLSLLTLREGLFCASDPRHDQTQRFLDFLVAVSQQLREYMWICFRPQFFCLGQRVFCLNYVKIEFVFYGNFIRVLLSDSNMLPDGQEVDSDSVFVFQREKLHSFCEIFFQLPPSKIWSVCEKISKPTRGKSKVPVKILRNSLPLKVRF